MKLALLAIAALLLAAPAAAQDPSFEIIADASVPAIVAMLRAHTDFDCPQSTRLVVTWLGETAQVAVMRDKLLCAIVTGPADGVRGILKAARGEPI